MEFLLTEIEKALDAGLYFVALQSALTLPDICSLLESNDTHSSGDKYSRWFDDNVGRPNQLMFTGKNCWNYRCSCLHSGQSEAKDAKGKGYSRVFFLVPGKTTVLMHDNVINDMYNIDIVTFCNQMIEGVRKWEKVAKETELFQRKYELLMRVRPDGFPPYIVGTPVIT